MDEDTYYELLEDTNAELESAGEEPMTPNERATLGIRIIQIAYHHPDVILSPLYTSRIIKRERELKRVNFSGKQKHKERGMGLHLSLSNVGKV